METTYLYYPAPKVFKILSSSNIIRKGYTVVSTDMTKNAIILKKKNTLFRNRFFEIRIDPSKDAISQVTVNRINSDKNLIDGEKEVIQDILKMF